MSSQGPLNAGTVADDSSVGTVAWSNPTNAQGAADTVYATIAVNGPMTGHYLKATNFGFTIPSGATINGVVVEFRRSDSNGILTDGTIKLVKGGVVSGTNKSAGATWPTSDTWNSFGGTTDLWGLTLTDTDINSSTFGVVLSPTISGLTSGFTPAQVDAIRITVYYTASGGTITATPGVATVTVSGVAPAASPAGHVTATPGVGTVIVVGVPPPVFTPGSATAAPGVATVTVSGVAPNTNSIFTMTPGVATVTVSGADPAGHLVQRIVSDVSGSYRFFLHSTQDAVGRCRVANDVGGYVLYVGIDAEPDLTAPPQAYGVSLPISFPVSTPPTGTRAFHLLVRLRDSYGLESGNQRSRIVTIDSSGNLVLPDFGPPADLIVSATEGPSIRVRATYPTFSLDEEPADRWRVWVKSTVPDPVTDSPDVDFDVSFHFVKDLPGPYATGTWHVLVGLKRSTDGRELYLSDTVVIPVAPATPEGVYDGWLDLP
jgi:hypothetical protein